MSDREVWTALRAYVARDRIGSARDIFRTAPIIMNLVDDTEDALDEIEARGKEIERLRARVEALESIVKHRTATLDRMLGTPCEQIRHQQHVERLEGLLRLILPMAKGYAHAHRVGSNDDYIRKAEAELVTTEAAGNAEAPAASIMIGMESLRQLARGNAVELERAVLYAASDLLKELPSMIDHPITRMQVGNHGVPGNTVQALEMWHGFANELRDRVADWERRYSVLLAAARELAEMTPRDQRREQLLRECEAAIAEYVRAYDTGRPVRVSDIRAPFDAVAAKIRAALGDGT